MAREGMEGTRLSADHSFGTIMQQLCGTPQLHQARQTLEEALQPHAISHFGAGLRWFC